MAEPNITFYWTWHYGAKWLVLWNSGNSESESRTQKSYHKRMKIYGTQGLTKIFYHLLIILKQKDETNEISLANSGILELFHKNLIANLTCAVQIWLARLLHLLISVQRKTKKLSKQLVSKCLFFSNVSKMFACNSQIAYEDWQESETFSVY